jgi:hypothetical protein
MSLDELNTLAKGFLVNNTLVVEAQIHVLTVVKELSGSCAFMHSKTYFAIYSQILLQVKNSVAEIGSALCL